MCEPCERAQRFAAVIVEWIDAVGDDERVTQAWIGSDQSVRYSDVEAARDAMEQACDALLDVYSEVTGVDMRGSIPARVEAS